MKKEEFLKMTSNEQLVDQIDQLSPDERELVKKYSEELMGSFFQDIFLPISEAFEKDPDALKKAIQEIENELIMSGSLR